MRHNRRLRWAAIPIAASLSLVLAGCTQAQLNGFLPGFDEGEPPVTNHTERVVGPLGHVVDRAARRRRHHLGPHHLGGHRLPPSQGPDRPPGAAALQHADRDLLHDRAAHPRARLLRLHGARPGRDRAALRGRRPRRQDRGHRQAVGVGLQLRQRRRLLARHPGPARPTRARGLRSSRPSCPTLYLPVGKKVEIELESRDVIHSFWVIDFLYKKDMFPGKTNYMSFTPEREGTYAGKCAELCGEYHSLMLFNVEGRLRRPSTTTYIESLRDRRPRGPARRRVRPQPEPARHGRARAERGAVSRDEHHDRTGSPPRARRRSALPRSSARATSSSGGSRRPTTRSSGTCT